MNLTKKTERIRYYQPIMKLRWYEAIRFQMEKWKDISNEYYGKVLGEINVSREMKKVKTTVKSEE